ncbi:unnamed protein product [Rangifer tarandus platyrhynchus]|uniref:Uncharacterized protein n=1 Tax=Rangifer tarandus platyrhynchus TaxID=3082113 RepID=A0ABN8YWJ3_RANTA|nr:unnamed protein product [Rangifer tarandus platyrhynchus]
MRRRLLQSDFYSETELQDNAQGRPYAEGKGQMPGVVQERRKATADLHRAGRVTGGKSEERLGPCEQQELVGGDTHVHRRGLIALDKKPQTTPLPPEGHDVITLVSTEKDTSA